MSNTNTMERLYGRCEQYAYAFARGKDAFADMAHDLFTTTALSDAIVADDEPRKLYTTVRNRAETIAAQSFKPLKEQSAKSATAQVSKLANFHTLGVYHRDGVNDHLADALDYARELVGSSYTKLVKIAVAWKTHFAKLQTLQAKRDVTETELRDIAVEAIAEAPQTASEAVAVIEAALEKLVDGDKSGPSPHADALTALKSAYPQDFLEHARQMLANARHALAKMEEADKPLPYPQA